MTPAIARYDGQMEMLRWGEERLGVLFRQDAQAIGLVRGGELIAVTVFDTFSGGDRPTQCQIHVASSRRLWWDREYAQRIALHAFSVSGVRRVQCIVSEDNKAAIRFARRLGCLLEGRLREAGPHGEDYLAFGLLRRECRWLPKGLLAALAKPR